MKITPKKQRELVVWEFFKPTNVDWADKTYKDIEMFFEWSEQGKHKDKLQIPAYKPEGRTYFHALVWGKKWAGIHIHELYEQDLLAGDGRWVGYTYLLEEFPREVVDFIKKEMFKGIDADIIEHSYQEALKRTKYKRFYKKIKEYFMPHKSTRKSHTKRRKWVRKLLSSKWKVIKSLWQK